MMEAESISQRFAGLFSHCGVWGRQIPWDRLSEGAGISCLLKCDGIVSGVKIKSITPFSPCRGGAATASFIGMLTCIFLINPLTPTTSEPCNYAHVL